jgi:hypothetical protein
MLFITLCISFNKRDKTVLLFLCWCGGQHQDDMLSKLRGLTGQLNDVHLERDQLVTRLEQVQKAVRDIDEGSSSISKLT